jgi:hypothetical protein
VLMPVSETSWPMLKNTVSPFVILQPYSQEMKRVSVCSPIPDHRSKDLGRPKSCQVPRDSNLATRSSSRLTELSSYAASLERCDEVPV